MIPKQQALEMLERIEQTPKCYAIRSKTDPCRGHIDSRDLSKAIEQEKRKLGK